MLSDVVTEARAVDRVPRATYRLQFNRHFTLAQARELVPYLDDLGVSHIYASPLLKAFPGSAHGYDASDYQELNPELGTPDDFASLHAKLARHQMGLVLDVVPNHMGIEGGHNLWWRDVLTHGPRSRYARCFDINWQSPDPRLRGKVALPILGERYHDALAHNRIRLAETDGFLSLQCASQMLPLSPESILTLQRRVAASVHAGGAGRLDAVVAEINNSPQALDQFIQMQHYLLMFSHNGQYVLNYRRFFNVTNLAGIRIEDPWVFDQAFSLVKQWLAHGWVTGFRVDHIDGLRHPEQFLCRLRAMAPKAWIVVEKILEPGEPFNPIWPVDGTTGYDFLNILNGIFVDPQGEKPLSDFYQEFTGDTSNYPDLVKAEKQTVIRDQLAAEFSRLTDLLIHISARRWDCRDFSRLELEGALLALGASFPVYRTYVSDNAGSDVSERDSAIIRAASSTAREQRPDLPTELFDFLEELLLFHRRGELEDDFVLRFQQLTGPIMAKAAEDRSFYCYARFAALNEVGGDPGHFGLNMSAFHEWCQLRQKLCPDSMTTTSTHDTKWGGDVRARLALLSERPQDWMEAVRRWSKLREGKWGRSRLKYLLFQALVGSWPLGKDRAVAYALKAAREAKDHTSWDMPDAAFEDGLRRCVNDAMEDSKFTAEVGRFVASLSDLGWINSLAQTLVKLTAPGVPDIYQGSELWDFSLVDPDNRRPVDFALRRRLLTEAKTLGPEEAWRKRESGLPKLWLIWKVLAARRRRPELFGASGAYEPVVVSGAKASHVLAFARGGGALTVAQRLVGGLSGDWADTRVEIPPGKWQNVLTDTPVRNGLMTELTALFPVALLMREQKGL